MYVSEVLMTFELLEKIMNLPELVKVTAVKEGENTGVVKVRIASVTPAPEYFNINDISKIGDAYREPNKYKAPVKNEHLKELPNGGDQAVS